MDVVDTYWMLEGQIDRVQQALEGSYLTLQSCLDYRKVGKHSPLKQGMESIALTALADMESEIRQIQSLRGDRDHLVKTFTKEDEKRLKKQIVKKYMTH